MSVEKESGFGPEAEAEAQKMERTKMISEAIKARSEGAPLEAALLFEKATDAREYNMIAMQLYAVDLARNHTDLEYTERHKNKIIKKEGIDNYEDKFSALQEEIEKDQVGLTRISEKYATLEVPGKGMTFADFKNELLEIVSDKKGRKKLIKEEEKWIKGIQNAPNLRPSRALGPWRL